MQLEPLKKVFVFGQTQSPLCKLKTLPAVQLVQSPIVAFQKVGETQATHLSPLNLGF